VIRKLQRVGQVVISFRSAGSCLEVRYGKVFVCGRNMVPGEALLERCGWLENPCQDEASDAFCSSARDSRHSQFAGKAQSLQIFV
jgi:hypothetical protein